MIRLGLCCIFVREPIRFRSTTASYLARTADPEEHVRAIGEDNLAALEAAIRYCAAHDIGDFRINSNLFPAATHPEVGYSLEPFGEGLERCGAVAQELGIRMTFHPDQFVVLNSPDEGVVERSVADLEMHAYMAERVGADVINIHGGGVYGDKEAALERLRRNLDRLSPAALERLTVENDDRSYTPEDLLPFCEEMGVPLCYDVHHHRCLSDGLSVEEATAAAVATWDREPLFHISSSKDKGHPTQHSDRIDIADWPKCWNNLDVTVEVEAKEKELAILPLIKQLKKKNVEVWTYDHWSSARQSGHA